MSAKIDRGLAELRADLLKWMLLFWLGTVGPMLALLWPIATRLGAPLPPLRIVGTIQSMRFAPSWTGTRLGLLLALAVGCGREVILVDPPVSSDTDTTGADTTGTDTTVVQRVSLRVTVSIGPGDTALATRLGFPQGRLAGARATARRVQGVQAPQTGITDTLGQVTLRNLIPGTWAITALRPLTEAERVLLDAANRDVTGFAGAGQFTVEAPDPQAAVEAVAGRQGTLVISEAHLPYPTVASGTGSEYVLGQYIEVHNNSFDTLYLDGMILGRGLAWVTDGSAVPCSTSAKWREDPEGLWTRFFVAFPGTGRTHRLGPGMSAIVAIDAIDHSVIHPDLLNLSGANFEFIGFSDVDNPQVPNMRNIPPFSPREDAIGHGPWWVNNASIFLAVAVDLDSLPRDYLPVANPEHVRIPKDRILDVLTSGSTPAATIGAPYCRTFVHESLDEAYAQLVDGAVGISLIRKELQGSPSDLRLLQRTRVSAVDFVLGPPSPGRAP